MPLQVAADPVCSPPQIENVKTMVTGTKKAAPTQAKGNEVDDFMHKLDHPMKTELEALRALILGTDPTIAESIKWNAPSFRTTEYFATANLRSTDAVQLIMHFGAKVGDISTTGVAINDPNGLLTWLAKDRATVKFRDMTAIVTNGTALVDIVRQWITHVR